MDDSIYVSNARQHNLKNVTVSIPKRKITVITGPSGSGKSSLAFDTIYAEGQRRYLESLSSYSRQFIEQLQPPEVDSITGLTPAISIDQKTTSNNPRSSVGTVTEIYDYLRILYSKIGDTYNPETGDLLKSYTPTSLKNEILAKFLDKRLIITFAVSSSDLKHAKGSFIQLGFGRCIHQGEVIELDSFNPKENEATYIVIDRIKPKMENAQRIVDSCEHAFKHGKGIVHIFDELNHVHTFSNTLLINNEISFPKLEPRLFSFNSPIGACPKCNGLGEINEISEETIVLDESLSLEDGAIPLINKGNSFVFKMIQSILSHEKIDPTRSWKSLPQTIKNTILNGSEKEYAFQFESKRSNFEFRKEFPGLLNYLELKAKNPNLEKFQKDLSKYIEKITCRTCKGSRLNKFALAVKVKDYNIAEICNLSIEKCFEFFSTLKYSGEREVISAKVLTEIKSRLSFLRDVGVEYLSLSRSANTLSGGESQRIKLATQLGSNLSGITYVLDEPTIGLHPRDNKLLINAIKSIKALGNTVIIVEHDKEIIKAADWVIDIGPKAGVHGGNIIGEGTPHELSQNPKSITGPYLKKEYPFQKSKERSSDAFIKITGCKKNNLKNIDVSIPLHAFTCITGVSGSGKSTFVHQILVPAIKSKINKEKISKPPYQSITGVDVIGSIIELDQSPIGRTPHSNPATFTGIFDEIRDIFSMTPDAKLRGYKKGRFSFNVAGGRCEHCEGNGVKKIEMHFLPDVFVECEQCNGSRYNHETLSILYKGRSIADILKMTIEEACEIFQNHQKIKRTLDVLVEVGLGYLTLGQPATTLSGGEAQRLKLSRELSRRPKGRCFYVFDEPSTGLHFQDIELLLSAIQRLVDEGHTAIVIEHNTDIIKTSDYVIDLGPGGGEHGGTIVYAGFINQFKKSKESITAKYL
jgi:excinuclease ABC subunit A